MISVTMVDANIYEVAIDSGSGSPYRVSRSQEYYRELCGVAVTHEWVIMQAFAFLMDQPGWDHKIVNAFELSTLDSAYPDFNIEMQRRFSN